MQPLFINVTGKNVVIAGGGAIAARKAKVLSEEHANITFVAPEFCTQILELAREHQYTLVERDAVPNDFRNAFLVIIATNSRDINKSLVTSLHTNQLVCVVDDHEKGNVVFPASVKRGHLQLAITTNGASPKLTKKLKSAFENQFDESWVQYTDFLFLCRTIIKKLEISDAEKNQRLARLLDERYHTNIEAQKQELEELSKL